MGVPEGGGFDVAELGGGFLGIVEPAFEAAVLDVEGEDEVLVEAEVEIAVFEGAGIEKELRGTAIGRVEVELLPHIAHPRVTAAFCPLPLSSALFAVVDARRFSVLMIEFDCVHKILLNNRMELTADSAFSSASRFTLFGRR